MKMSNRILALALSLALCGVPELMAQQAQPAAPQNNQPASPQTLPGSAIPDPSKGPLEPVPSQQEQGLPEAPAQQTPAPATTTQPQPASSPQAAPQQKPEEPVGAATAEAGATAGGAASKPAGTAIAPAKQHQVRSLLIKLGAIAGGAIAIGTVYGLTKASPSNPPGSKTGH